MTDHLFHDIDNFICESICIAFIFISIEVNGFITRRSVAGDFSPICAGF